MTTTANAFLITADHAAPVSHALDLHAMQDSVGGYIEPAFTIPSPVPQRRKAGIALTGYVNEEGAINGMPIVSVVHVYPEQGRVPLCGPMLVCGLDQRDGETVPLTPEELAWIGSRCRLLAAVGKGGEVRAVHMVELASDLV